MPFPEHYTRPFISSAGNEIWGIYGKAHQPETPHSHQGGVLFTSTQPMKVFSHPCHTLLYATDKVDKRMRAILLPAAGMHYAIYEQDYQAVLIHIRTRRQGPMSEWSGRPLKAEKEGGCEKIYLAKETALTTRGRDVFLVSEKALKILNGSDKKIAKIPRLPYCVYSLNEDPQTYKLSTSSHHEPFYKVEI